MAVMRPMLETGLGSGLLTADSILFQRQARCSEVPMPLPTMCWWLPDGRFPLYSTSFLGSYWCADVRLPTTVLLLKVISYLAKWMASVLPPCRIKAAEHSLLQIPSLLPQGMAYGGDRLCSLGILTGCLMLQPLLKVVLLSGW